MSFVLFMSCVCHAFVCLFISSLWSPAGKGLTNWLSFVMLIKLCFFHFPIWYPGLVVVLNCIDF